MTNKQAVDRNLICSVREAIRPSYLSHLPEQGHHPLRSTHLSQVKLLPPVFYFITLAKQGDSEAFTKDEVTRTRSQTGFIGCN